MVELLFPVVPVSFYGFDSAIYVISALIGFAISYKAFRLYQLTGAKQHMYLSTAFAVLSVSMLTLSLTSAYTYFRFFSTQQLFLFDPLFGIDDVGYWLYFVASMVAYGLLAFTYLPHDKKKFFPGIFITINYFAYFNILLFFLMAYVAFRTAINFFAKRNWHTFLVAGGFFLIMLYHALLPFAIFSKLLYVMAHFALVGGFASLLLMLVRVGSK